MNILYICPGNYKKSDGVYQKVKRQSEFWASCGHSVKFLTFDDMTPPGRVARYFLRKKNIYIKLLTIYSRFGWLASKTAWKMKCDLVYSRHMFMPYFFLGPPRSKIILEINGDIVKQNENQTRFFRSLIDISINYYNNFASGIVFCTDGLQDFMSKIHHRTILTNCILCRSEEIQRNVEYKKANKATILKDKAICFMASKDRPCYDFNRILKIFDQLDSSYNLWVIGQIKKKHFKVRNPARVKFWGPQFGEDLNKLLLNSFACIGGLNSGLILVAKASPLKVRSYLEHATPTFAEDNDVDFDDSLGFYKGLDFTQVKSDEEVANQLEIFLNSISDFNYLESYADKIMPFTMEVKEKQRLSFFEQVAK